MFKKWKRGDSVTEEDVKSILDEAHESGTLKPGEAEMIENILSFRETVARDIMTHRGEMEALDGSLTLEGTVPVILESSYSRFPVYKDDLDTILGILTFKDVMRFYLLHKEMRTLAIGEIPGLIREAPVVPETRRIENLFQYMKAQKTQLILVVDEYGQISGLLTMEDILEEIVGNIFDEYDSDEDLIQHEFAGGIVMDGSTPLDEAGEELGYDFSGEQFETLNGYLTSLLGHIPTDEDKVVKGKKYLFHILKTENHTIRKVRAERLPENEMSPAGDIKSPKN